MHVIIAPDCFTGTLTAPQAAEAMAAGWAAAAPHDRLSVVPLSDGGPGFVDVLAATLGGRMEAVVTSDPLGRDVPATVLVHTDGGRTTAYVESAQACGLHLLDAAERDPRVTSSSGVGRLIAAAADTGADRVVVGLGGSGTNDAGAGMLAALGCGRSERLGRGGLALGTLTDQEVREVADARTRLGGIELVMATDVDSPLLGLQGASAVFAEQKGATPEHAQQLEAALGHFVALVSAVLPPRRDLLSGKAIRPDKQPGAGAAGGLGYGLMLLGATRVSGVQAVLQAVGFDDLLARADLVVSGEGRFDWQSLRGKVAVGVAEAAQSVGVPAIVIAGQTLVGRRESMAAGLSGVYAVAERPSQVSASLADPAGTLAARTQRVARTWSPGRRGNTPADDVS